MPITIRVARSIKKKVRCLFFITLCVDSNYDAHLTKKRCYSPQKIFFMVNSSVNLLFSLDNYYSLLKFAVGVAKIGY